MFNIWLWFCRVERRKNEKTVRSFLCALLAMVTVFNINMSVFAVSEENQPMLTEDSLLIISDVISNMRADKEAYGMSAVDFDHLFIGDEIPVYVSNQDSTIRSSNVHYYPILEDSKCVAIVVLGTDESGNLLVNASTWFSDKLNDAEINAIPLSLIPEGNDDNVILLKLISKDPHITRGGSINVESIANIFIILIDLNFILDISPA